MNRLLVILLILAGGYSSCLKNKRPKPKEPLSCRITEVVSRDADSSINYTKIYEYDEDQRLVKRSYYLHDLYQNPEGNEDKPVVTRFEYDGDGKLIRCITDESKIAELTYSGGQISGFTYTEPNGASDHEWAYSFTYSGDKLTDITLTEDGNAMGTIFELNYTGNNLELIKQVKDGSLVEWHQYDEYMDTFNFHAPFVPELFDGPMNIGEFYLLSENLPLHRKQGLTVMNSSWFLAYEYFTDKDFWTGSSTRDHWSDVISYQYKYDCR